MCAVTDKVWTIKGVREGDTPFTTLAPLQISNETSFTGTHFHTVKRLWRIADDFGPFVIWLGGGFMATRMNER